MVNPIVASEYRRRRSLSIPVKYLAKRSVRNFLTSEGLYYYSKYQLSPCDHVPVLCLAKVSPSVPRIECAGGG